jgi:hypothetical protein
MKIMLIYLYEVLIIQLFMLERRDNEVSVATGYGLDDREVGV